MQNLSQALPAALLGACKAPRAAVILHNSDGVRCMAQEQGAFSCPVAARYQLPGSCALSASAPRQLYVSAARQLRERLHHLPAAADGLMCCCSQQVWWRVPLFHLTDDSRGSARPESLWELEVRKLGIFRQPPVRQDAIIFRARDGAPLQVTCSAQKRNPNTCTANGRCFCCWLDPPSWAKPR